PPAALVWLRQMTPRWFHNSRSPAGVKTAVVCRSFEVRCCRACNDCPRSSRLGALRNVFNLGNVFRLVRHGAVCSAVLLSVATDELQWPGYNCHGGVQLICRHTTAVTPGICVLHWPYRKMLQATRRRSHVV